MGQSYSVFYVKFNKAIGFNDAVQYGGQGGFSRMNIVTPTTESPDEPYYVTLYEDFGSRDYDEPFEQGAIIRCSFYEPVLIDSEITVSFGDVVEP